MTLQLFAKHIHSVSIFCTLTHLMYSQLIDVDAMAGEECAPQQITSAVLCRNEMRLQIMCFLSILATVVTACHFFGREIV